MNHSWSVGKARLSASMADLQTRQAITQTLPQQLSWFVVSDLQSSPAKPGVGKNVRTMKPHEDFLFDKEPWCGISEHNIVVYNGLILSLILKYSIVALILITLSQMCITNVSMKFTISIDIAKSGLGWQVKNFTIASLKIIC